MDLIKTIDKKILSFMLKAQEVPPWMRLEGEQI